MFKGKTLLYVEESMLDRVGRPARWRSWSPARPRRVARRVTGTTTSSCSTGCCSRRRRRRPASYGEEPLRRSWEGDEVRDRYEMRAGRRVPRRGKPVLGICRGIQILNVAFGGTLYQDIATQVPRPLRPPQLRRSTTATATTVDVVAGSRLARLYPGTPSGDGQQRPPPGREGPGAGVRGRGRSARDGIVEAVRFAGGRPIVAAVQWHPEFIAAGDRDTSRRGRCSTTSSRPSRARAGEHECHEPRMTIHEPGHRRATSPKVPATRRRPSPRRRPRARAAQPAWAARPLDERTACSGASAPRSSRARRWPRP